MKLKNVGFFQQHAEKIILTASIFIFLLVVMVYVTGNPYKVKIKGQKVGPSEVENMALEAAKRLDRQLKSPETKVPDVRIAPYTQAFQKRSGQFATGPVVLLPLGEPGLDPLEFELKGPVLPYALPRPPVPDQVKVRPGFYVLGDFVHPDDRRSYITLVGDREPLDFRSVTISGAFDMEEWERRLDDSVAEGSGYQPLPTRYWRATRELTAVYLLRQEQDPVTGQWGQATLIPPLPDQVAYLPTEAFEGADHKADEVVDFIRLNQELIARPEFPPCDRKQWVSPEADIRQLSAGDHRKLRKLQRNIDRLKKSIDTLQMQMDKEQQRELQDARRPKRQGERGPQIRRSGRRGQGGVGMMERMSPGRGMSGDLGMERGVGRSPRAPVNRASTGETNEQRFQQLITELQEKSAERDEIRGVRTDTVSQMNSPYLGRGKNMGGTSHFGMVDPMMYGGMGMGGMGMGGMGMGEMGMGEMGMGGGGYPGMPGMSRRPDYGRDLIGRPARRRGQDQADDEVDEIWRKITVWAHDLTVRPGRTYRYRLVVAVMNPLFRQRRVAPEQRQEHFNRLALEPDLTELAESPWSEPVRIDPDYYFFMIAGSAKRRDAQVEIWHIFDGQWHEQTFKVRPGDPIGGSIKVSTLSGDRTLDMGIGSVVVDIASESLGPVSTARLLYLDPGSSRLTVRSVHQDRDSDDRVRLQNEKVFQDGQFDQEEEDDDQEMAWAQ